MRDNSIKMIKGIDYPHWYTEEGLSTVTRGYLQEGETISNMYWRLSRTSKEIMRSMFAEKKMKSTIAEGHKLDKKFETFDGYEDRIFQYLWKGWLCPASPVVLNFGTDRGLPISCFLIDVDDSIASIGEKVNELMQLTKAGGGVGINIDRIRPRGAKIGKDNGLSEGVVPFLKIFDSGINATNQGSARRGAASVNMSIRHGDIDEFISIRRPIGDINRQCLNLNHCVVIDDKFMEEMKTDEAKFNRWKKVLKTRFETGQPYILYSDNVNKKNPQEYQLNDLKVWATNICSEITLFSDPLHSFVCCLSSLNLSRWEEWKDDPQFIKDCIYFLDTVMEEFLRKSNDNPALKAAYRFALKSRALGLGVLGYHTLLQEKNIPFIGLQADMYTRLIFKKIQMESHMASHWLGKVLGVPEWCKNVDEPIRKRHTHLTAVAPTTTNSILAGGVSQGIEPIAANAYFQKTAKGNFIRRNPTLEKLLKSKGQDKEEVWNQIIVDQGSVRNLDFLTDEEKEVFLTFAEINQLELVKQAGIRQEYIDQSQSLNLAFPANATAQFIHEVHHEAWKTGVKSLYYLRTFSLLKGDVAIDGCKSCEA
jgi:ribonucleoside-diphosphate reductase alpha chain